MPIPLGTRPDGAGLAARFSHCLKGAGSGAGADSQPHGVSSEDRSLSHRHFWGDGPGLRPHVESQAACALETRLNAQAGKNEHIQFLGRFEDVCCVTTIEEVEGLMLGGIGDQGLSRFRKRRQSARMQSDEAKGTQEGRIRRYQRPSQTPA